MVPTLMTVVLLIVVGLRWTIATSDVVHAAGTAARVASESRGSTGAMNGRRAAILDIAQSRWCRKPTVDVVRSINGSSIVYRALVDCRLDPTGLTLLRLRPLSVSAASVQIVDTYRSDR